MSDKVLVRYDVKGKVAFITLDDPPANTYTHEMMRQLDDAIVTARFDRDVEVIVLHGHGEKFFSAGANIGMLNEADPEWKYCFCLHANETLNRLEHTPKLVIVDGVFSMEGDIAKLPEIVQLCEKHDAFLMVDDAHGVGVLGDHGRGTCQHFGLTDKAGLIMGTFSKSLASVGGFVAGDEDVMHYIQHHSRALMFSASMPPASVASVSAAVDVMLEESWRHEALWRNNDIMRKRLKDAGFNTGPSETPIIPAVVGEDMAAFKMCSRLAEEGVFVNPVISPAVEKGNALIRLSLMATHTEDEIHKAMDIMARVGKELGIV